MNATTAVRMPRLSTLLRLGRISNIPTVWTNVLAGSVIAGGDRNPGRIVLIMLAMTAFYVGGMYLNDFFDREIDARDRPGRPIHAGEIRAGTVSSIGFGLLAAGIALMIPFGLAATIWGALLAAVIVLYDVWHKGNALSPIVMGLCRALVYIGTGAALAGSTSTATMIAAIALASHVAGITYAAKQESLDRVGNLWPLALLAVPLFVALPTLFSGWIVVVAFLLLLAADTVAIRLLSTRPVPGAVRAGHEVSHVRRTAGTCPRHCPSSPAGPRREPDLADMCATRRPSRIAASRKYSARVIEDQITTLRPYNARYTGDPRSIFRKAMWRRSPVYHSIWPHEEVCSPVALCVRIGGRYRGAVAAVGCCPGGHGTSTACLPS